MARGRPVPPDRCGRPRPDKYYARKPFERIEKFAATTNLAIASGVASIAMANVTEAYPGTVVESLPKITGSAAGTNMFWDQTFPVATAPGTKYTSIVFDIYVTKPTTSSTAGTGSGGVTFTLFLAVTAFGGANNIACTLELNYGWNRVELCSADFSTINGTATWAGSTFIGIRWKITGTTGHNHSCWMREVSWI